MLKVVETRHHKKGGSEPEEEYRKKDEVVSDPARLAVPLSQLCCLPRI